MTGLGLYVSLVDIRELLETGPEWTRSEEKLNDEKPGGWGVKGFGGGDGGGMSNEICY